MSNIIYQREDIPTYLGMIVALVLIAILCIVSFKFIILPMRKTGFSKIPIKYKVMYQIIPMIVMVCLIVVLMFPIVQFALLKYNSVYNLKMCEGDLRVLSVEEHQYRDGSLEYTCSLKIGEVTFSKRNYYSPEEFTVFSSNPYVRVYYVMNHNTTYIWKIEQILS